MVELEVRPGEEADMGQVTFSVPGELKGCSRCGAGETSKQICEVVRQLLPLYRQDETDAPDSAGGTLPDKKGVIEALQLLEAVLFPGRMSAEAVGNGMLEPFLEERLSRIFRLLVPEIMRALPLRWKGEYARVSGRQRDVEDLRAAAEELTLELFRRLPRVRQLLIKDVEAAYNGDPAALSYAEVVLAYPGLQAIASHRIAHELYRLDVPVVPRLMSEYTHAATGTDIHPGATIGERFFIDHATGVVIGETTEIGNNVKIYQGVTLGAKSFPLDANGHPIKHIKRHPTIEDDVVIYANATILGGDTVIGRGAVVGGNVFLTQSVPPGARVVNRGVGIEIQEGRGH